MNNSKDTNPTADSDYNSDQNNRSFFFPAKDIFDYSYQYSKYLQEVYGNKSDNKEEPVTAIKNPDPEIEKLIVELTESKAGHLLHDNTGGIWDAFMKFYGEYLQTNQPTTKK